MNRFWNGFSSDRGSSGATELNRLARGPLIALLALLLAAPSPLQAAETATGSTKFIPTFLVSYGRGSALVASACFEDIRGPAVLRPELDPGHGGSAGARHQRHPCLGCP